MVECAGAVAGPQQSKEEAISALLAKAVPRTLPSFALPTSQLPPALLLRDVDEDGLCMFLKV